MDRFTTAVEYAAIGALSDPVVTGSPKVGEPLTATGDSWTTTPEETHYAWSADGAPVGTDSATYTPGVDDLGKQIEVTVSVSAGDLTGSATSAPVQVTNREFTTGPAVSVTGSPRVGKVLSMDVTTSVPAADQVDRAWFRDGQHVADGATYRARKSDLGHQITARVTVGRDGYDEMTAFSDPVRIKPGAAVFGVTSATTVVRGGSVRVRATGLLAREKYVVRLGEQRLGAGRASASGFVDVKLSVPVAGHTGRQALTVTGSYADRKGGNPVTVTRN